LLEKAQFSEAAEKLGIHHVGIHHEREGTSSTRAVTPLKMNQRFSA
jgi:hypothetical protein